MRLTPEDLEAFRQRVDEHLQSMGIAHGGVIASLLGAVTRGAFYSTTTFPEQI